MALAAVPRREGMAIVAVRNSGQTNDVVAVAQYGSAGEDLTPDVGIVVEDEWQGLGLGAILLTEIMRAGEGQGFSTFHAEVLAENSRMLRLLARYAKITQQRRDRGVITVLFRLPTDPPELLAPSHCSPAEAPH